MVIAAILGAGRGTRLGAQRPKQFLSVGGEMILLRSLRVFVESGACERYLVCVPAAFLEETRRAIAESGLLPSMDPVTVLAGGETRGDTLAAILEALEKNGWLADSILLTHDAVRPFIDGRIIAENIAAARLHGACCTCVPAVDTVFLSRDGRFIDEVPARSSVFHAQTPQTFRGEELYRLIRAIPPEAFRQLTDGCSVYTYHHLPVAMVRGSENNIKITYASDLEKAELIAAAEKGDRHA